VWRRVRCGKQTAGDTRRAIRFIVRMVKAGAGFLNVRARVARFGKGREGEHDLRDGEDEHRRPPERAGQDT